MTKQPLVSYAQNREDLILLAFFPDVEQGFYVDVGANHPTNLSVTKLFYDRGWRGINIEPIESLHRLLQEERPRDINLAVGMASAAGRITFTEFVADGLSTFSSSTRTQRTREEVRARYELPVDTLANVLDSYRVGPIHFMKIDVEGYERDVLLGNDWERFRPDVLCIEAAHVEVDWRPILNGVGYRLALFDGLNEYFLSINAAWRETVFREEYPRILEQNPEIIGPWRDLAERTTRSLERATTELGNAYEEIETLHQRLRSLEKERLGWANSLIYVGRTIRSRLRR